MPQITQHDELFKPFQDLLQNRHDYARKWKVSTGGKVIGLFNTYVPEEIICAAGMLPVRVMGNSLPQTITDEYCSRSKWCSISRNALAEGLLGHYDYLDGIVMGASCFHTQEAFAAWVKHIPTPFWHYIFVPGSIQSKSADMCLIGEYEEFKNALEGWTGKQISTGALDNAIEVYNENRHLMMELYATRKNEPPPVSGSEAMKTVLASQLMDKAGHNTLLTGILSRLSEKINRVNPGIRLMVLGSENNDIEILQAIESWGGNIVIDDHCLGSRYFFASGHRLENRLETLARQCIERPQCPTKDFPERRRLPHVLDLAREYKVQAAVFILQKFCEPHQFDIPSLEAGFNALNIPTTVLEIDTQPVLAQVRMRVESLLDMVHIER